MSISIQPWTIIGYYDDGRPIYAVAGGAITGGDPDDAPAPSPAPKAEEPEPEAETEADDDDADDDDADDDEDDEAETKSKSKKKDDDEDDDRVYTKKDIDEAVRKRQEAKKEARRLKKENAELKQANETEQERLRREAADEATQAAVDKYKPALVMKSAEAGLLELGVKPEKMSRIIRLMDMEEIDVDDELNVDGVDEQIDEVQKEYPELFQVPKSTEDSEPDSTPARKKRKPAPKADASDRKPAKKPLSAQEQLAQQLSELSGRG